MIERITALTTTVSAVGCGLIAGLLLAFSISVIPALESQPASSAIATMQQINVAIVSPIFLTVFLGSAATATVAAAGSLMSGTGQRTLIVSGAVLYVVGCVVVTMAINIPMNDALASVDPHTSNAATVWTDYANRWTAWNHARTAMAAAACAALTLAARA